MKIPVGQFYFKQVKQAALGGGEISLVAQESARLVDLDI
jgi:hypothetical protein